jgi:hypothetical protein
VLDGVVSALLHKGKTVHEDQRAAIEERPALIFSRKSTLYVTFAEVQWSAAKCRQVLDSAEERKHFMQAVDLRPVHCQLGGEHLLTVAQARQWLAEVATGAEPATAPQTGQVELPAVQVSDAPNTNASLICGSNRGVSARHTSANSWDGCARLSGRHTVSAGQR